jgi:hypothetical protein
MNDTALISALISARLAQVQLAAAAKLLRISADGAQSAVQIVEAAQQNFDRLANVAAGVGGNLDLSV